jgi:slpA
MRYALHRGLIAANNLAEIQREFDKPRVKGMNTIEPLTRGDYQFFIFLTIIIFWLNRFLIIPKNLFFIAFRNLPITPANKLK